MNTTSFDPNPCAILVVEDSLLVRMRVIEHLALVLPDAHIEGAENVADAVEYFASRNDRVFESSIHIPDVVVLDLELPGCNGLNLLRALKREHPEIGVVVFTCLNSEAVRHACLSLGADYFVNKDEDIASLEIAVNTLVACRKARMEIGAPQAVAKREQP